MVASCIFWLLMLAIVEGLLFWPFDPMSAAQKAAAFALAAVWFGAPVFGVIVFRHRHRRRDRLA
ncbi:MAG: hypothetical protein ACXVES_09385 [Actinomycetota bacterium]